VALLPSATRVLGISEWGSNGLVFEISIVELLYVYGVEYDAVVVLEDVVWFSEDVAGLIINVDTKLYVGSVNFGYKNGE
jgi:hypothetical protein